jgi:hypothetical protein
MVDILTPKRHAYDREISISIDTPFCNLISLDDEGMYLLQVVKFSCIGCRTLLKPRKGYTGQWFWSTKTPVAENRSYASGFMDEGSPPRWPWYVPIPMDVYPSSG